MRRSGRVFLTLMACAACSESASLAERRGAASPSAPGPQPAAAELPALSVLARPPGPSEPVAIVQPVNGAEIDVARATELVVRVRGPAPVAGARPSLELSLDGARPRPVVGEVVELARLLEPNATLGPGAHDLVLVAVAADGSVLDPAAGGVASTRFFVGPRPTAELPARLVCLRPAGTHYGTATKVALDFVVVPAGGASPSLEPGGAVVVTVEGSAGSRRARAAGPGPFLLGDFESGDHRVTLAGASAEHPVLPGACVFTVNRELEPGP